MVDQLESSHNTPPLLRRCATGAIPASAGRRAIPAVGKPSPRNRCDSSMALVRQLHGFSARPSSTAAPSLLGRSRAGPPRTPVVTLPSWRPSGAQGAPGDKRCPVGGSTNVPSRTIRNRGTPWGGYARLSRVVDRGYTQRSARTLRARETLSEHMGKAFRFNFK